jgi:hypothetical protein
VAKILVRVIIMLGLAALIAFGWFGLSQAAVHLPVASRLMFSRLYSGGPFAVLQSVWDREVYRGVVRNTRLQLSWSRLWVGVADNMLKVATGTGVLVLGWSVARWLRRTLAR